jgi:exodeoxyribonuclease-5
MIIDYKSSPSSLSAWARDRLGEAQLPLYATVWQGEYPVAGLALAAVSYGKISLNGVVADTQMQYDKIKAFRQKNAAGVHKRFADWPEALEHWRGSILEIAGEFIAGNARNSVYDPKQYTVLELAPLLRLEEGAEWRRQRGTAS